MTHDAETVERVARAIYAFDGRRPAPWDIDLSGDPFCDTWLVIRKEYEDMARAALEAMEPRVKVLEWVTPSPTTDGQWQDTTGIYDIEECILFIGHVETGIRFKTVKEAKAAAQADYERRILSALETTP